MNKHNEMFNKETETIQKNQTEILYLKNTLSKLKNSIDNFNSRLNQAKESENRSFWNYPVIWAETNKKNQKSIKVYGA